ncbi:trichohyalin isoform X2 [Xyrichtys novacula]|uniref:Trichohyalin isoform X2 n=1 Tax=Xyrichtys novacula TaxID=13765 RepID=A0AAV1G426_XYRNO|nr:trichohyalin isoform X2 [Xyrichtys novacula]
MTDTNSDGEQRDTEELLYKDLNVNSDEMVLNPPTLKLDHCDLLLDAIDAQLCQLQVQHKTCQDIFKSCDCNDPACLSWSRSLSKDTGLGSTTQTNDSPMSRLGFLHSQTMERTSERSTGRQGDLVTPEEVEQMLDRRPQDKKERESRKEQVIWRLEKLLGDTCDNEGMAGESHPPSDSICTEDFVTRFRDEMVELALESDSQQQCREEEAEGTQKSDCDDFQSEQKPGSVFSVDRGETVTGMNDKDTKTESKKTRSRQELESGLSDSYAVNRSCCDRAGGGERYETPQMLGKDKTISDRSDAERETEQHIKTKRLAGVPVWSFDTVSIDCDLDSVSTEQVRQHIHWQPGFHSLIQSVMDVDSLSSNQSDCDTPTQEDGEPLHSSDQKSSHGIIQSSSACIPHRDKKEVQRVACPSDDNDKDTDEEINHQRRRCRPHRTSEKMQSDYARMKELLSTLQQRCQKEEETLKRKKTQLRDVELSFSDIQTRRKHALQELEQLKKEKRSLEFDLRDHRAEKDFKRGRLHELQRQRQSGIAEPSVFISVLEREEMDRQLDSAKAELFAEQKRAREKIESMQEKLEETREELQRATEVESLLRARCACLEEKQKQEKDQMEGDLGECRIRVGTLERMLTQKELQLVDLKEQCGTLKTEMDGLKGELQDLQTQHCTALKEAQEQVHRLTLKEKEVRRLRDSLEQQKNREEELRLEALGKVHKALEEARRKWEAEKVEAVQVHCGIVEEQNRKRAESMRSEIQQEKCKSATLQHQVLELKTRVQELETLQRKQESVLAVTCKSLKKEHQAKVQRMQRQMAEESQKTAQQFKQAVQLAEAEADRHRLMLKERESSHHEITAELDQQLRHCAQELRAESQHLLLLVRQSGARQSSAEISPGSTVAEALQSLKERREQLKHTINHLQQELHTQKETIEQLRRAKERELSIQRQQLRMERDQAMDCLKERLIQEHIEELSSLNVAHMCDGGAEGGGGGVAASLRRQLKAKDLELRQVQRSMAQWKEQTVVRLACKFEEELTAELQRCKTKLLRGRKTSKTPEETQRKPEGPQKDTMLCTKEVQNSVWPPSLPVAAPHSSSDVASLKLLSHLQRRVKQLRLENQVLTSTPLSSNTVPSDLSGSYLAKITQDISGIENLSSIRTVSS